MSTEEKAKAYDEALERAKKFDEKYGGGYAGFIFPELAESEDERIRRKMIEHFKSKTKDTWCNMPVKSILAWLEKQKESSITANDLDEEIHRFFNDCIDVHEAKLYGNINERVIPVDCYEITARHFAKWAEKQKDNKFAPRVLPCSAAWFEDGEVKQEEQKTEEKPINWTELTWKDIVELEGIINNVHYEFRNGIGQESFGKEVLEKFREYKGDEYLDEQKEQKTVLYSPLCNTIKDKIREYVANNFVTDTVVKTDVKSIVKAMEEGVRLGKEEQKPADIKAELKNAYQKGWDEALLQLPKEVDSQIWQIANNSAKTWEESFAILNATKKAFDKGKAEGLKEQKPAEWSEEDEENFEWFDKFFRAESVITGGRDIPQDKYLWFKSLRPSWKPSEEDKKELDCIINILDRLSYEEFCESSRDQDIEEERFYYKEIQFLKRLKSLRPSWKPSDK